MKERNSLRYGDNVLSTAPDVPSQLDFFVCHEWEEFVGKLCNLEDPHLKEIGYQELAIIKAKGGGLFLSSKNQAEQAH
jgi:hypothetical protein